MSKRKITIANGRTVSLGAIVWLWRRQTVIPKIVVAESNHTDFVRCVHLDNQGRPYEEKKSRVYATHTEAMKACPWNEGLTPDVMFRIGKLLGKTAKNGRSLLKNVKPIQVTRRSPDLIKIAKKANKR